MENKIMIPRSITGVLLMIKLRYMGYLKKLLAGDSNIKQKKIVVKSF